MDIPSQISEGLIVWKGEESDLGRLPFDRDNSVWVDQQKTLHFKMRKRKNKPWGSHLQATCQCHKKPHECIPCIFFTWSDKFEVGHVIWNYKPVQFQETMRRQFLIYGCSGGGLLWISNSICAGRATETARNGSIVSHILTSGDWEAARSFMIYCNVDELDRGGVLSAVLDGSDSESEGH